MLKKIKYSYFWSIQLIVMFSHQLIFKGKFFSVWKALFFSIFFVQSFWRRYFPSFFLGIITVIKPVYGIIFYKRLRRRFHKRVSFPFWLSGLSLQRKGSKWLAESVREGGNGNLSLNLIFEFFGIITKEKCLALSKKKQYYKNGVIYRKIKNYKW